MNVTHENKSIFTQGLSSLNEPISDDCQLVFWYPKTLSYETALWMAKEIVADLKIELAERTTELVQTDPDCGQLSVNQKRS